VRRGRSSKLVLTISLAGLAVALAGCEGPAGPPGAPGPPGEPGTTIDAAPSPDAEPSADAGPPGRGTYLTGPGLVLTIQSASIDPAGVARARIKITDGAGVPLDREGRLSEGAVAPRFTLAWLATDSAGEAAAYTSYITRDQTSPITHVTATQASTEQDGDLTEVGVGDGVYDYTFVTPIVVTEADRTLTHTVGVYATRSFEGVAYSDDATFDFVPSGAPVTLRRDVVSDAACNRCHDPLSAHGGARKKVALCVLCHSPQTIDPDTGHSVDLSIMAHKIHRGESLPSVAAGTPYQIIGYQQNVADFSTVVFPQPIERCETCHTGANGDYWKRKPSLAACTSCHDDIAFQEPVPAGMVLHSGGTQPANAPCKVCHAPSGSIAGIVESHLTPAVDPARPEPAIEILSVTGTAPGQQPVVRFKATVAGAPRDLLTAPLTSLRMTVAGPNQDYGGWWQATAQGTGATGTLVAIDAAAGVFEYTFPVAAAIPLDATGSYTLGIEASNQPAGQPRFGAVSPTVAFAVTDAAATPRREVVARDRCNACHGELAEHGGSRKNVQYCLMCHGPTDVNDERAPHPESGEVHVHSVDFKVMIHKIHAGRALTQAYVLGSFPAPSASSPGGTPVDFGATRYPGRLADCATCHVGASYTLPLPAGRLSSKDEIRACNQDPAADANAYCEPASFVVVETRPLHPETAVCTSCHDSPSTAAHAEVMTSASGVESCATCHGPGQLADVERVHRRD
jgi:OmcA/MtrC family decaheme c-type cytochrome